MYPEAIRRMVLVGAAGLKPTVGEIADIFLIYDTRRAVHQHHPYAINGWGPESQLRPPRHGHGDGAGDAHPLGPLFTLQPH